MSTPGISLNTGEMHGGGTVKKPCRMCQHENVFMIPKFEIINQFSCSMIIFPHAEPQYCENCSQAYQFVLVSMENPAVGFIPIKNPTGQIITPPKGIVQA